MTPQQMRKAQRLVSKCIACAVQVGKTIDGDPVEYQMWVAALNNAESECFEFLRDTPVGGSK